MSHVEKCQQPPKGWECARAAGHEGPCAARALTVCEHEWVMRRSWAECSRCGLTDDDPSWEPSTDPCPHCGGDTFEHCLATPSCAGPKPSGAPQGWFAFGAHAGIPGRMEFSEEVDEAGMPMWERRANGSIAEDGPASSADKENQTNA